MSDLILWGAPWGIAAVLLAVAVLRLYAKWEREVELELHGKERLGFTAQEREAQATLYPGTVDRRQS